MVWALINHIAAASASRCTYGAMNPEPSPWAAAADLMAGLSWRLALPGEALFLGVQLLDR
jgi:hypothetical protein